MDNDLGNTIDDFRSVCVDNINALKAGQTVYIYKDDVFFKTLALCNKENMKVYYSKTEDYYTIKCKNYNNLKYRTKKGGK